jgi:hypothetical protein
MKKILIIVFVISLLMYHGCVVKTEKGYEAHLWGQLHDGKISQQEFERLKKENSYFKHFFNFREVIKAVD